MQCKKEVPDLDDYTAQHPWDMAWQSTPANVLGAEHKQIPYKYNNFPSFAVSHDPIIMLCTCSGSVLWNVCTEVLHPCAFSMYVFGYSDMLYHIMCLCCTYMYACLCRTWLAMLRVCLCFIWATSCMAVCPCWCQLMLWVYFQCYEAFLRALKVDTISSVTEVSDCPEHATVGVLQGRVDTFPHCWSL